MLKSINRIAGLIIMASMLQACGAMSRMNKIGQPPTISPIENIIAPARQRSISLPMPDREISRSRPNSLWRTGARAFFKDQRAAQVGDILTVNIDISDSAAVANSTARSRQNTEKADITNFLGLETVIPDIIGKVSGKAGDAFSPAAAVGAGSTSGYNGAGTVDRSESIRLTVAAIVKDVLPNGNMLIEGRQEVRVNFEKRLLLIAGIVRPQDISAKNVIQHTQIAEARIIYGGAGQITDVQQPRYGAQLYDVLFPF